MAASVSLSPGWACALLILGLALYVLSFAFGRPDRHRTHRSATWARMANSATLVLAALLWWSAARETALSPTAGLVFWGMICSFAGDLLMARVIRLPHYPIPGMVAFGATHVLYIVAYALAGSALGLGRWSIWTATVTAEVVVAAVLWRTLISSPTSSPILNYGALAYALLLGAMSGSATSLAVHHPRFATLAVGALLFLVSDALLGNRLLRDNNWFLVGDAVWALYIAGQSLIVFTTPCVLPLLAGR